MRAYQTDGAGVLTGPVECDPDPREPGRWLVPGGAVLEEPPAVTDGQRARWTGTRWVVERIGLAAPAGGGLLDGEGLAAAADALRRRAMLAARSAGIPYRGSLVASDPESMVLLLAMTRRARDALAVGTEDALAAYAAELGAGWRGWSAEAGVAPVAVSAADMVALEDAAVAHVGRIDAISRRHADEIARLVTGADWAGLRLYDPSLGYGAD